MITKEIVVKIKQAASDNSVKEGFKELVESLGIYGSELDESHYHAYRSGFLKGILNGVSVFKKIE